MSQQLYLGVLGQKQNIHLASSTDGQTLVIPQNPLFPNFDGNDPFSTALPVSLCPFGKKDYLAAAGLNKNVYLGSSTAGQNWTISHDPLFPNFDGKSTFQTQLPVSTTEFDKKLYMLLVGLNKNIYLASMNSSENWTISNVPLFQNFNGSGTFQTQLPVSLTAFQGTLYVAAVGLDNKIYLGSSTDGQHWTISQKALFQSFNSSGTFQTKLGVSLSPLGGLLYLAAVGEDKKIYLGYSGDGQTWNIDQTALFQNFDDGGAFQTDNPVTLRAFEGNIYMAAVGQNSDVYMAQSSGDQDWSISSTPLKLSNGDTFQSEVAGCLTARRVTQAQVEINPQVVVQTRLMENFIEASPVKNLSKVRAAAGPDGNFYVVASDINGNVYELVSPGNDQLPWTASKITCWEPIIDFAISSGTETEQPREIYILTASHAYQGGPTGGPITIDQNSTPIYNGLNGSKLLNIRADKTSASECAISYVNSQQQYGITEITNSLSPVVGVPAQSLPIVDFVYTGSTPDVFAIDFGSGQPTKEYVQNQDGSGQYASSYSQCEVLCDVVVDGAWLPFGVDTSNNLNQLSSASQVKQVGRSSNAIAATADDANAVIFSVGPDGVLSYSVSEGPDFSAWTPLIKLGGAFAQQPWQLTACSTQESAVEPHVFAIGAVSGELIHIWQESETSDWRMVPVVVNHEPELIKFASYATQIGLVSDTGGAPMPMAQQEVKISASDYLSASINGRSYSLGPNTSVSCLTDVQGNVTVTTQTRALSTPSLRVSALSLPAVSIQPEAYLKEVMGSPQSATDLANVLTNARTRVTNQPVVSADSDTIAAAANGIFQLMGFLKTPESNADAVSRHVSRKSQTAGVHFLADGVWPDSIALDQIPEQHWALHFEKGKAHFQFLTADEAMSASASASGQQDSPSWTWGSVWNSIEQGISELTDMVISKTTEGLQIGLNLVTEAGQKILNYAVDKVQQVWDAVEGIFAAIKTSFQTLFEWLGSIFNWDDILLTHEGLKTVALKFFAYMQTWTTEIKSKTDTFFADTESMLTTNWEKLLGSSGSATTQSMQVDATSEDDLPAPGPHANWILNAVVHQSPSAMGGGPVTAPPSSWKDDAEAFSQGLDNAFKQNNLEQAILGMSTQMFEKGAANLTLNDMAMLIGDKVISEGLGTLNTFVDSNLDYLSKGFNNFTSLMQQPWEIPVISSLYQSIAKEQLTLLDLCCLLAAIPVTVEYKVVIGVASAITGDPSRPQGPFTQSDINLLNKLTPEQLFGGAPINWASLQKRDSDSAGHQTLKKVQGCLLLLNSAILAADCALLAANDIYQIPVFVLIQQALTVVSAGCTYPYGALMPADVHSAKMGPWGARLIFMVINIGAMLSLGEATIVIYPLIVFVEGVILLLYSLNVAHVEGGGSKYLSGANIQAYLSTILQLSAPVRPFLMLTIDTAAVNPVGAIGAAVAMALIYLFGSVAPIAINTVESVELIVSAFSSDDAMALPQHA